MFILEKQGWRQKVPALNDDIETHCERKVNVIASTRTDKHLENDEGDNHQKSGEDGTQGNMRLIAMQRI